MEDGRYVKITYKDKAGKAHEAVSKAGYPLIPANEADETIKHIVNAGGKVLSRKVQVISTTHHWLVAGNSNVDLDHVNAELKRRIASVGQDLKHPVTAISGYRSYAKQVALYALYLAGRGPLAARPGTSNHNKGLAVDCYVGGVAIGDVPRGRTLMKKHGLVLGAKGEAWHVEMVETGSGWRD